MATRAARGSSEPPWGARRRTYVDVPTSTGRPPAGPAAARARSCIRKTLSGVGLPAHLGPGRDECLDGPLEVVAGVGGRDLGPDPGLALGYDGVRKPDHVDPFLEHRRRHPAGHRR